MKRAAILLVALLCLGFAKEESTLTVVNVTDSEPDSDFDQTDINAAVTACSSPCRLVFPDDWFTDVQWTVTSANVKRIENCHLRAPDPIKGDVLKLDGVSGVVITGCQVDGRKDEQPKDCSLGGEPCTDTADGIGVENSTDVRVSHTLVEDIQNGHGVHVVSASSAVSVLGSVIRHLGCHEIDTPCPVSDPSGQVDTGQTNRNTIGVGVEASGSGSEVIVRGTTIKKATKIGIQAFNSAVVDARDNLVEDSMNGIVSVSGGLLTATGNTVKRAGMTGHTGAGISFSAKGAAPHTFDSNTSIDSGGIAFQIGVDAGPGTTLTGNSASGSCQDEASSDYQCDSNDTVAPFPSGPTLTNSTSTGSLCTQAVLLDGWDSATVSGGTFSGAYTYGLRFLNSNAGLSNGSPSFTSTSSGTSGVWLESTTSNTVINTFSNSGFASASTDDGTGNTVP